MTRRRQCLSGLALLPVLILGCRPSYTVPLHERFGWVASEFFGDPQVVALCEAIQAKNLSEVESLVAGGADINARGSGNMTPLLWAAPDHDEVIFKRLLELGADPNVPITSDVKTRGLWQPGMSVTEYAFGMESDFLYQTVMQFGGDVHYVNPRTGNSLLHKAATFGIKTRAERIAFLVESGIDLNHFNHIGETPAMTAAGEGHFPTVLQLLNLGADFQLYQKNGNKRLIHFVARHGPEEDILDRKLAEHYREVVAWLDRHGESMESANADRARWREWGRTRSTRALRTLLDRERAERLNKQEREAAVDADAVK